MKYGIATLLHNQRLLIILIDSEAQREVGRNEPDNHELLPRIFQELGLTINLKASGIVPPDSTTSSDSEAAGIESKNK
jgi:hypothetical protein